MAEVKWDDLEDKSNCYASRLIMFEGKVSYFHSEGDVYFKVECAMHDPVYCSSLRLSSPQVIIGCCLERSYIWASSISQCCFPLTPYRNSHLYTSARTSHLPFCHLLLARNFRVRSHLKLVPGSCLIDWPTNNK